MKITPPAPDAVEMLRLPARAGIYACSEESARALFHAGPNAGFNAYRIDLNLALDETKLHHVLSRALHFPEWYGHNWDALADCLTDMSWNEADGYVILMQRAEVFANADPAGFSTLLGILRDTVAFWRDQGQSFWVLFIGDIPELGRLEVHT
ncbi:barstar family protein [Uliginosibacterium paludis]|uniref:Barstar family protein n=1 Tax=Uliginosibacterium paludis TaxID=1615952 RepID=A0ABV2CKM1_9RHOO